MTSTARQLRQPPTIEAIERVPYFADVPYISREIHTCPSYRRIPILS